VLAAAMFRCMQCCSKAQCLMHPAKISVLRLVRQTCCALQRVDRYDVPDPTAIEEGFEQWASLSQAHMRAKKTHHFRVDGRCRVRNISVDVQLWLL
jgi:hypothetical protein